MWVGGLILKWQGRSCWRGLHRGFVIKMMILVLLLIILIIVIFIVIIIVSRIGFVIMTVIRSSSCITSLIMICIIFLGNIYFVNCSS